MKKHLTDAAVQRISRRRRAAQKFLILAIPALRSELVMAALKASSNSIAYGGKLKRKSLGRWPAVSLAAARKSWRKTREAIARGEQPGREGASDAMLFEVASRMAQARPIAKQSKLPLPSHAHGRS